MHMKNTNETWVRREVERSYTSWRRSSRGPQTLASSRSPTWRWQRPSQWANEVPSRAASPNRWWMCPPSPGSSRARTPDKFMNFGFWIFFFFSFFSINNKVPFEGSPFFCLSIFNLIFLTSSMKGGDFHQKTLKCPSMMKY